MKLAHIEGENPNLSGVPSMPFSEFLKLNHCEDAELVWKGPFTSFGYGYFDEIPAADVLKHLDAFTVKQFLSHRQTVGLGTTAPRASGRASTAT